ncbi:MAG: hypothetical protein K8T91_25340 [Planctomycetes bacterium]|nr:hypothetical protein [Planctomycetota bacterium]
MPVNQNPRVQSVKIEPRIDDAPTTGSYSQATMICQTGSCSFTASDVSGAYRCDFGITNSPWTDFKYVSVAAIKSSSTYNPSVLGELLSVTVWLTSELTVAGTSAGVASMSCFLVIRQDSKTYVASFGAVSLGGGFTQLSASAIGAGNFYRFETSGQTSPFEHPDFSASGDTMEFGFGFGMGVNTNSTARTNTNYFAVTLTSLNSQQSTCGAEGYLGQPGSAPADCGTCGSPPKTPPQLIVESPCQQGNETCPNH